MRTPISRKLKISLVSSAVLTALSSSFVFAQEQTEEQADEQVFEQIMVTARKKSESIIEVPMSISTISAMEITDRNLVYKEDIYRTVAGAANPRDELILRGLVGSNDSAPGTTSSFTDGIPYDFSDLYDVERVEILRGPQGTLYGSNAIGGTVRIITTRPQLDEFEVNGSFQVNNQKRAPGNELRGYGAINIPLNDTMAMRFTGSVSDDPKPNTNVNTGVQGWDKNEMIRGQFLWQPEDDLAVNLSYIHEKKRSLGDSLGRSDSDTSIGIHSYYSAELSANPDAPFGYDVTLGAAEECSGTRVECLSDGPIINVDPKYAKYEAMDTRESYDMDLIALTIEKQDFLGLGDLNYTGSYREEGTGGMQDWSRTDGQDLFRTWIIDDYTEDRTTHELRLQSNDITSKLDWTVGYFYDKSTDGSGPNRQYQYHGDGDEGKAIATYLWGYYWGYLNQEFTSEDGSETQYIETVAELGNFYWDDPNIDYEHRVYSYFIKEQAIFGEVGYTLDLQDMGELELTGGIRFYDLSDSDSYIIQGIWNGPEPTISQTSGSESGHRIKLSASYRPSKDMSVYALYSEGYRPGGNNLPALPQSCSDNANAEYFDSRYESDEIQNYELGYKGWLLDNKVSVAMAVYQIDWSGVQVPISLSCGFSYTANASTAQTRGLEFESSAKLTDDLSLTFNFGYTNAKMTADVEALDVEKGDEMTMVPKYNAYLALDQGFTLWSRQAYIRADISAYGKYNSYFKGSDLDLIPAYEAMNLSGRIEVNDNTNISVHINNLFDKKIITYKRAADEGYSGAQYVAYGKDRNITIRFDFAF
jgi:outer membrane receptor protein involved in Fe transport